MNNHETILRMIEEVDPKDEKVLLDINARVWAFMNLTGDFKIHFDGEGRAYYRHNSWAAEHQSILRHTFDMPKYTTSRDAIKSIRPDGWMVYDCSQDYVTGVWNYALVSPEHKSENACYANEMLTEELAELHATIQAIAYERQKGHDDE